MRRALLSILLVACGSSNNPTKSDGPAGNGDGPGSGGDGKNIDTPAGGGTRTVFVIPMENEPSSAIYGNTQFAPYINNTLMVMGAHTTNFQDELPNDPSEPHYVYMEGGSATFSDTTFTNDNPPSAGNSTASTTHLVNQLEAAGVTWMSYQEGISGTTCPISGTGFYAPKHDPFIFFQDVSGNPPSTTTARCKSHHKAYSSFATDLAANNVAQYVFITPNLCHDMHGDSACPTIGTNTNLDIQAGDQWLQAELPRILDYANAHDGIVFVTWDEGDSSNQIPFIALGPRITAGGTSGTLYNHGSVIKTIDEMYGITPLSTVANDNDLSALYKSGQFP